MPRERRFVHTADSIDGDATTLRRGPHRLRSSGRGSPGRRREPENLHHARRATRPGASRRFQARSYARRLLENPPPPESCRFSRNSQNSQRLHHWLPSSCGLPAVERRGKRCWRATSHIIPADGHRPRSVLPPDACQATPVEGRRVPGNLQPELTGYQSSTQNWPDRSPRLARRR